MCYGGIIYDDLRPNVDDTHSLGNATYEFKDLYIDGVAHIDTISNPNIDGDIGWIGATVGTLDMSFGTRVVSLANNTAGSLDVHFSDVTVFNINSTTGSEKITFGDPSLSSMTYLFASTGLTTFKGGLDVSGETHFTGELWVGFTKLGGSLNLLGTSATELSAAAYYTVVTETPIGGNTPYELRLTGIFTGTSTTAYEFEIDGAATFKWRKNINGAGFGAYTPGVSVSTTFVELEDDLQYAFFNSGTSEFSIGDKYEFTADSAPIVALNVNTITNTVTTGGTFTDGTATLVGGVLSDLTTINIPTGASLTFKHSAKNWIELIGATNTMNFGNVTDDPTYNFGGDGLFTHNGNVTIDILGATDAILTMDGSSSSPGTLRYESDNTEFFLDKTLNVTGDVSASGKGKFNYSAFVADEGALELGGSNPAIVQNVARASGGIEISVNRIFATNTTSALATRVGTIGVLANLDTDPTPPSSLYMFLGAKPTTAFDDAVLKIDQNDRIGILLSSTTRPTETLDVAGNVWLRGDNKILKFGDTSTDLQIFSDGTDGKITTATNLDIAPTGVVTIGDGGTTDFSEFEADGTLEFNGAATVFDDIRVPITAIRITGPGGTTPPDEVLYKGGVVLAFGGAGTDDEKAFFNVQIPHSYREGTDITPHVHWVPEDNTAGNVRWVLTYSWANINAAFPGESTEAIVVAADETTDKHQVDNFSAITGSGKTISSMLICSIQREDSDGTDTYNNLDAYLVEIDFHFEMDTAGSRAITTK